MKECHTPFVNARYWTGITLASIFGTNLGDLYAHTSKFGIVQGISILALLAALVFIVERFDKSAHEVHYWLVIMIIRTGATNIADYLAFRLRIPVFGLSAGLAVLLALLAWSAAKAYAASPRVPGGLPDTNATYWMAMLTAGVFGTVVGDVCSHLIGQGLAAVGLSVILGLALLMRRRSTVQTVAVYWITVAVARTAGTAIGDWLAENKFTDIGLPLSTVLSGCAFVGVLLFWPRPAGMPDRARAVPADAP
jgi:uncharacterized membrane-anchored protein